MALCLLAGCEQGPKYVPVSGVVKIDGKPYDDGVVTFQPIASSDNQNPGRGSSSYTDAEGKFRLQTDDGHDGAVPGKHLIRIRTKGDNIAAFDPKTGTPDNAPTPKGKPDIIPREWHVESDKTFDVPAAGTDKADFDISTKKR